MVDGAPPCTCQSLIPADGLVFGSHGSLKPELSGDRENVSRMLIWSGSGRKPCDLIAHSAAYSLLCSTLDSSSYRRFHSGCTATAVRERTDLKDLCTSADRLECVSFRRRQSVAASAKT